MYTISRLARRPCEDCEGGGIGMCDCESPEIYTEQWPKARKEHQCDECYKPIKKGSAYYKFSGKWDGEFSEYKRHERCHRICRALENKSDCCMAFGEMKEWLREHCRSNKQHRVWTRRKLTTSLADPVVTMNADAGEGE